MPGENHPGYSIRRRRLCQTLNVLLIVLAFAGCRTTKNGTSEEALNAIKAASKTPLPITEITIQRVPGFTMNPSPFYTLTLQSDGTATYIGYGLREHERGTYRATIPQSEFVRLAKLIEDSHFGKLKPSYGFVASDMPYAVVSVIKSGRRKTVKAWGREFHAKYEKSPAKALEGIERHIDAIIPTLPWKKVSDETKMPNYAPDWSELK